jgi:hypothetical protein
MSTQKQYLKAEHTYHGARSTYTEVKRYLGHTSHGPRYLKKVASKAARRAGKLAAVRASTP